MRFLWFFGDWFVGDWFVGDWFVGKLLKEFPHTPSELLPHFYSVPSVRIALIVLPLFLLCAW